MSWKRPSWQKPRTRAGMPQQPLHGVQVVQALVEQHAAALALPGGAPAAAGVVGLGAEPVGDDPAHAHDLAQFAALDELLDLQVARLGAQLEHAGENLLGILLVRGDQPLGVGFVRGDGLLHHHVQALLQRGDAQRGVLVMRRGDDHRVHQAGADQLLAVGEGLERLVAAPAWRARRRRRRRVRRG